MAERQRSWKRTLVLVALLATLAVLLSQLFFGNGSIRDNMLLSKKVEKLQQQNDRLARRNRLMAADVKDLKQGTEAVEEIARKDLGMIKRGETFYQIVGDNKLTPQQPND